MTGRIGGGNGGDERTDAHKRRGAAPPAADEAESWSEDHVSREVKKAVD